MTQISTYPFFLFTSSSLCRHPGCTSCVPSLPLPSPSSFSRPPPPLPPSSLPPPPPPPPLPAHVDAASDSKPRSSRITVFLPSDSSLSPFYVCEDPEGSSSSSSDSLLPIGFQSPNGRSPRPASRCQSSSTAAASTDIVRRPNSKTPVVVVNDATRLTVPLPQLPPTLRFPPPPPPSTLRFLPPTSQPPPPSLPYPTLRHPSSTSVTSGVPCFTGSNVSSAANFR